MFVRVRVVVAFLLSWVLAGVLATVGPLSAQAAVVTTPGGYVSLTPTRLLDTRTGLGAARAPVGPGATVHLQVLGRGGVPASGVTAAVLNVTVTGPTGNGVVSVYADGTTRPTASNLNYVKAQTVPNLVIAPVGSNGKVALYNGSAGTTQLVADVFGYYRSEVLATPGPVANLRATPASTSIALSWTNPTDASLTGVMIRRSQGATPPASASAGTLVTDAATPATSFTNTALTPETLYSYALFAHNAIPAYAVGTTVSAITGAGPSPGTYTGSGFDACTAPAPDVMAAWLGASPYRAIGIYIGGNNRACTQPELTASWVSTQQSAGWHLVPIYFGVQPYCTTSSKPNRFTAANAASSGQAAAEDAVVQARMLGLASGSTIFYDIEAYSTTDSACRTAVLTFQSSWTSRLHGIGFLSGFYGSLGSGVKDQVAVYNSTAYARPDYLWFARYDGVATVSDATIPDTYWLHRRIKQYQSPVQTGGPETYGDKTVSVDRDLLDVGPMSSSLLAELNGDVWSHVITR